MANEELYLIQIEEVDSYTDTRKRYYMKSASDVREVAKVPLHVAQHCVANMGNDFRYRRHAVAVKFDPDTTPGEAWL